MTIGDMVAMLERMFPPNLDTFPAGKERDRLNAAVRAGWSMGYAQGYADALTKSLQAITGTEEERPDGD